MLRVRTVFTGVAGAPYYSNLYFAANGLASDAHAAVVDLWAGFDNIMVNSCSYTVQGEVAVMDNQTGDIVDLESVAPATGQGASSQEMLPPANQVLVQWRTGQFVAGREIRGRTFIPAIDQFSNNGGQVLPTVISGIAPVIATYLLSSAVPSVWSKKNGVAIPIAGGTVWPQFAQLRSRRD